MYAGVPTAVLDIVPVASSARAMPKSMTRGPSGASSTLAGLKSRCTTPAWWMAASAVIVPIASRSSSAPRSGPPAASTSDSDGPSMYSLTMYGRSPSTSESRTRAVQNADTRLAVATSAANRARALGSPLNRACSSFTATRRPSPSSPR